MISEDEPFIKLWEETTEFKKSDPQYVISRQYHLNAVNRGIELAKSLIDLKIFENFERIRILDIGCGSAGVSIAFAKMGPDVVRFNWAKTRVESHKVNVILQKVAAESLVYTTEFDLVLCNDVIEHVADYRKTISKIAGVLKPRGWLYMTFPNKYSIVNILRDPHYQLFGVTLLPRGLNNFYAVKAKRKAKTPVFSYIPAYSTIIRILRKCGFKRIIDKSRMEIKNKLENPNVCNSTTGRKIANFSFMKFLISPIIKFYLPVYRLLAQKHKD